MKFSFDKSFLVAGLLALLMAAVMAVQGQDLKTAATPMGILDLEFAHTNARVEQVLEAWSFLNLTALWNTLIDYAFLMSYGFFFYSGIKYLLINSQHSVWYKYYPLLTKLAWLPTILDAIENTFLLGWLLRFIPTWSPALVFWMVSVKFALAGALLVVSLTGWVINIYRRFKPAI